MDLDRGSPSHRRRMTISKRYYTQIMKSGCNNFCEKKIKEGKWWEDDGEPLKSWHSVETCIKWGTWSSQPGQEEGYSPVDVKAFAKGLGVRAAWSDHCSEGGEGGIWSHTTDGRIYPHHELTYTRSTRFLWYWLRVQIGGHCCPSAKVWITSTSCHFHYQSRTTFPVRVFFSFYF